MKHTLLQLESRVLLAGAGEEVFTFIHSEAVCGSVEGGNPYMYGMSVSDTYETYFTTGEVEICVKTNCNTFSGALKTTGLPADVLLTYKGPMKIGSEQQYSMSIKKDGTADRCLVDADTGTVGKCSKIANGRINRP